MGLIALVYTSVITQVMLDKELENILAVSRRNNLHRNVTGMLLYKDGHFIQALEGEEAIVMALYNIIAVDPRHQNVFKMFTRRVNERSFGEWQMGFNRLDSLDADAMPGYTDFLKRPFDVGFLMENPSRAAYLLEFFKTRSVF
ncbi:MAG: BLUF domain-containing protein [Chloroflexota bacterium]|nr:BLUF domain-containing protein [Chloroflexota bacterium]